MCLRIYLKHTHYDMSQCIYFLIVQTIESLIRKIFTDICGSVQFWVLSEDAAEKQYKAPTLKKLRFYCVHTWLCVAVIEKEICQMLVNARRKIEQHKG